MSEAQKKADKTFYQKMISLGWIKRSFWIHGDDIKDVSAYVDSKKSDRKSLIDSIDKGGDVK